MKHLESKGGSATFPTPNSVPIWAQKYFLISPNRKAPICAGLEPFGLKKRPGRWPHRSEAEQLLAQVVEGMGWLNPGWVAVTNGSFQQISVASTRQTGGGHGHGCLLRKGPICWKTSAKMLLTICVQKKMHSQFPGPRPNFAMSLLKLCSANSGFPKVFAKAVGSKAFLALPEQTGRNGLVNCLLAAVKLMEHSSH